MGNVKTDNMADLEDPKRSAVSSDRIPFIVSSNIDKVDLATRKPIKSHARRGKTQKRGHLAEG